MKRSAPVIAVLLPPCNLLFDHPRNVVVKVAMLQDLDQHCVRQALNAGARFVMV
jgi:hypothetical protein